MLNPVSQLRRLPVSVLAIQVDPFPGFARLYGQINLEISVRQHVAHLARRGQRQFGVGVRKFRIALPDVTAGFFDHLEITNHRILRHFIL